MCSEFSFFRYKFISSDVLKVFQRALAMGVLSTSMTYRTFVIKASYFLIFLSFEDRLIPIFEFIKD